MQQKTRRRWIDVARLRPERVIAALREPGAIVNVISRLAIVLLTVDALVNAGDDRFA